MHERSPGRWSRFGRTYVSVRTWRQWLAVANFVGYDAADRRRAMIDRSAAISPTVSFRHGERIEIGPGAHVGQGSCLWAGETSGRIVLGSRALLAPRVFVTSSNYDFDAGPGAVMDLPRREADVVIGADTWLGVGVIVLPGVAIGDGTIVAAGAVVTANLPAGVVAAGVPARVVRNRGRRSTDGTAELASRTDETLPT